MKLSKGWLIQFFTLPCMIGVITYIIFNLDNIIKDNSNALTSMFFAFKILCIIINIIMVGYLITEYLYGSWYLEQIEVPLKNLKINIYENLIIIVYRNKAFAIKSYNKKILKDPTVFVTNYYNRKKEETGWSIRLPYMK